MNLKVLKLKDRVHIEIMAARVLQSKCPAGGAVAKIIMFSSAECLYS